MKKPAAGPDEARAHEMAAELRVALGKLIRKLREQGHAEDLTWSQKLVLLRLEKDGPATVTELAKAEGVRPQSMGATIATLQAAGLVSGEPDPGDGRRTILSLTEACRKRLTTIRAAREDWLFNALQSKLTPAQQAKLPPLINLLSRLGDS